jgi:hypothetical protein
MLNSFRWHLLPVSPRGFLKCRRERCRRWWSDRGPTTWDELTRTPQKQKPLKTTGAVGYCRSSDFLDRGIDTVRAGEAVFAPAAAGKGQRDDGTKGVGVWLPAYVSGMGDLKWAVESLRRYP